jgi:hypothetical protein
MISYRGLLGRITAFLIHAWVLPMTSTVVCCLANYRIGENYNLTRCTQITARRENTYIICLTF